MMALILALLAITPPVLSARLAVQSDISTPADDLAWLRNETARLIHGCKC